MESKNQNIGYLPDERPPIWKLLLYALQQVIVMFPGRSPSLITAFRAPNHDFRRGLAPSAHHVTG
jgi:uracil permease